MTKARRQSLILGLLLLGLGVVLYVQFTGTETAGTTAVPSNPVSRAAPARGGQPAEGVTDVRLELLQGKAETLPGAQRNPFRFRAKPAPPPPPQQVEQGAPVNTAPPVPAGPPPPPPIMLRYIGMVEAPPPDGRLAVLTDGSGRNPPVYGRQGDIIEGRYRLLSVGPDSIEIAYLDGRGRQTIRLSGQ